MYRKPFGGDYPVTLEFGAVWPGLYTAERPHSGIDYGLPMFTNVLSIGEGTVIKVGNEPNGYGNYITVNHSDGLVSIYAHLSDVLVSAGQGVAMGQPIGHSGNSGNSTGAHLHLEVKKDGKPIDPVGLFEAGEPVPKRLKEAGELPRTLRVTARSGAKAWHDGFEAYGLFEPGQKLFTTGNTAQWKGLTFMEVYPLHGKYWVAVHDGETQILDADI